MKSTYILIVAIIALYLIPCQTTAQDNIVDEVIWVVGDESILKSDVENARLELQLNGDRMKGDPYCVIPEQMAIQKLFMHQAKLDSIIVTEAEVSKMIDAQINHILSQIPGGTIEKIEEYFNKPISQIRETYRESFRENKLVEAMKEKLIGDIKLTPADIRRYYSKIPEDSLPFIDATVEVAIVTLEPKVALEEIERIKGKLREYTESVNKGEYEFSTLARLWSKDKESAKRGGELGFMGKAELVSEYAAVAFQLMDPKKVSKIVETEYGYHIIQLIEKRGDRMNTRHILLKPEVSQPELDEAILKLDSVKNDIKAGKFTFEEAASFLSYDKDTRNNKGLMVNPSRSSAHGGTSHFELAELPQEIGKIVYNMSVGEISKPFTMISAKQKDVVAIVKLISKIEGHKANLKDDFQTLKTFVENEKREEILNKWIASKQKSTYIRINDKWKNCDFQRDGWIKE